VRDPLVLIHGGGGTWRQWRPVMPLLEPHHELLAVNLVGHLGGAPLPVERSVDIAVLADGVESDMEAAGWSTAHLAGTSLGAWVALELAKRGRARSCTALAPVGGWDRGGDRAVRMVAHSYRFFYMAAQLMARDPSRWSRRPGLRRMLYWHHFARTDAMDPGETARMIVGIARCDILPALVAWVGESPGLTGLDRIACPVQFVFPSKDRVMPRHRYGAQLIASLPEADVRVIEGAGHVATWDAPEEVAQVTLALTTGPPAN
jgi:pimeloyl-ACP methyl ester carboxylesterase